MHALNRIFLISNIIAALGWLLLFITPSYAIANQHIIFSLAAANCLIYGFVLVWGARWDDPEKPRRGNFFSMAGVVRLFEARSAVLVGWVHYLAFDLMIGLFILIDATGHDISHLYIVPVLFLTLMLGPLGLLSYLILRLALV